MHWHLNYIKNISKIRNILITGGAGFVDSKQQDIGVTFKAMSLFVK